MRVYDSNDNQVGHRPFYDWGLGNCLFNDYAAGTYRVHFEFEWQEVDVPDLTLKVVANEQISLTQNGYTGQSF